MPGRNSDVEVIGLPEFRRELKKLDNPTRWTRDLAKSQREIGVKVAGWSRFAASSLGGPFAHFQNAIAGGGGITGARVRLRDPTANATFWGALKHTGWYARPRYAGSAGAQHPEWVGARWQVGMPNQGPYAINPAITAHVDDIVDMYGDAVDRITADAFDYRNRTSTF